MLTEPSPLKSLARLELETALAGRYSVERELGRGGMGVVYLAHDLALERPVAIKVLPVALAAMPSYRERFLRETRTAASFSHPHVVPVHAVEDRGSLMCFVMGFVDGESLADRIERSGPLPASEVARLMREIGWALSYAHARGVIHRDVKADNILLERATGRALLTDFGIARVADSNVTGPGTALGTPHYISPEQVAGDPVDGRSDLYSLGVVGFFALTARFPFEAPSLQALLGMHVSKPPPPLARLRPDAPRRLVDALDRCLRKDAENRWESADAFVAALPSGTATFAEVAPQVRNFHRAATLAMNQVLLMLLVFPILALLRPAAADLLIPVLLFGSAAIVLQLRGRALLLAAQGYGYDDLKAAVQAERQQRSEEAEALGVALGIRRSRPGPFFWTALGAGIALALAGWWLRAERAGLGTLGLIAGIGISAITVIVWTAGNPRRRTGLGRGVAAFWTSPAGRGLFRLLAKRQQLPVADSRSPAAQAVTTWDRLTPEHRSAYQEVHLALGDLETRLQELGRRERAVEDAIRSAGTGSPATANQDPTSQALLDRRRELLQDMSKLGDQVRQSRQRLVMACENLRLQLSRLAGGMGSPIDALKDVAAARELLSREQEI